MNMNNTYSNQALWKNCSMSRLSSGWVVFPWIRMYSICYSSTQWKLLMQYSRGINWLRDWLPKEYIDWITWKGCARRIRSEMNLHIIYCLTFISISVERVNENLKRLCFIDFKTLTNCTINLRFLIAYLLIYNCVRLTSFLFIEIESVCSNNGILNWISTHISHITRDMYTIWSFIL